MDSKLVKQHQELMENNRKEKEVKEHENLEIAKKRIEKAKRLNRLHEEEGFSWERWTRKFFAWSNRYRSDLCNKLFETSKRRYSILGSDKKG